MNDDIPDSFANRLTWFKNLKAQINIESAALTANTPRRANTWPAVSSATMKSARTATSSPPSSRGNRSNVAGASRSSPLPEHPAPSHLLNSRFPGQKPTPMPS